MLVEAELIEQAKERLGDKNFELIMEALGVDDYDEVHKKCCCPIHDEKTPSMLYDSKRYRVKCFGCGVSFDFIDAYMRGKQCSFMDAVQQLFKHAEIQHIFNEKGVKPKREYRYPHEEPLSNGKENVYRYLGMRGISKETVDYMDVREDTKGNCVFMYRHPTTETIMTVKYRPSHKVVKGSGEAKMWAQPNADTTPLLWNLHKVNLTEPLLICEGCIDAMAAVEAGWQNATSVPFGASNTTWIDECWDILDQFNLIIVCSDNDEPGVKMRNDVIARLGSWRTRYVEIPKTITSIRTGADVPVKDVNEVLYHGGKELVMNLILNAKEAPLTSVTDISDIESMDLTDLDGIKTGIRELDNTLIKLFFGTLTIVSGQPGAGKSSFLSQLMIEAMEQGYPSWMFSQELPGWFLKSWLTSIAVGRRGLDEYHNADGETHYKVKPEYKQMVDERYRGMWYLYDDSASNKLDDVIDTMTDMVRRRGVKLCIIDNLMVLDLACNENNILQKQTECVNRLISFAATYNVCVILVCHPRKLMPGTPMGMYDVSGSSTIVGLAQRVIALRRVTEQEKAGQINRYTGEYSTPPCPYSVKGTILKDRMLGRIGKEIGMFYDAPSRRFFTNPEEYSRQYSCDTHVYRSSLEYPIKDMAEEAFS